MLNPMIAWEPGVLVRYHGSDTNAHGTYRAYPCTSLNCNDPGLGVVRFELADSDGDVVLACVRPVSITPLADRSSNVDEGHADCIEPHRGSDGEYVDCDGRPL